MNNNLFEDAVEQAYLKLLVIGNDEFNALLKKNEDGEYAKIVRATSMTEQHIEEVK